MNQQRYEKEIEEILKKTGDDTGREQQPESGGPPRRRSGMSLGRTVSMRRVGINYKALLLAGLSVLIVSYVMDNSFVFLAALALLVAGYVFYYRAPRATGAGVGSGGAAGPKMWRGRPVDPEDPPGRGRRS